MSPVQIFHGSVANVAGGNVYNTVPEADIAVMDLALGEPRKADTESLTGELARCKRKLLASRLDLVLRPQAAFFLVAYLCFAASLAWISRETVPGFLASAIVLFVSIVCYYSPGEKACAMIRYYRERIGNMELILRDRRE